MAGGGFAVLNQTGAIAYRTAGATVEVLDLARGQVIATIPLPEGGGTGRIALSPDGATLAVLTGSGFSVSRVSDAVPIPACVPPPVAAGVVAVCGASLQDLVMDAGHLYATNRARNQVEVVSLATGALEAPILVGSQPIGLDLSPDGTMLYVANSGGQDVSVVDLSLRHEVRRITVPSGFMSDRPFSLAVAASGLGMLTTTFAGSGFGAVMYEVDFGTGAVERRSDFFVNGSTTEATRLEASGDRSHIAAMAGDISSGPVFLYSSATDTWGPEHDLGGFRDFVALDRTASRVVVSPGVVVLDGDLVLRGTIPAGGRGVAVTASGARGYAVKDAAVDVLDLNRGLVTTSVPLPEPVGVRRGIAALSPDDNILAVLTEHGISFLLAPPAVLDVPYAVWSHGPQALDGLGGWIAVGNEPTAGPGQVAPTYLLGEAFHFAGDGSVTGVVGLATQPGGKYAVVVVEGGNDVRLGIAVPFNWRAGRFYFPLVYEVSPGVLGAWLFDHSAGSWIPLGSLHVPTEWGRIAPASASLLQWYGTGASDCAHYPRADVFFSPTYGFTGATSTPATLLTNGTVTADCRVTNTIGAGWAHFVAGDGS